MLTFENLQVIPVELKNRAQWVAWRVEKRNANPIKVPVDPRTNRNAKVNSPSTWGTFEEACDACAKWKCAGVGYVFNKSDPFVGVDLDKCRDPKTGALEPWAEKIVKLLDSYTEVSPSGRGLHVLAKGSAPAGAQSNGVEIYDDRRYFTVTGYHLAGTPLTIEERPTEVLSLYYDLKTGRSQNGAASEANLIPLGQRNNMLASIAGSLRRAGLSPEDIEAQLLKINAGRCQPPLPESEVRGIAKSIAKYKVGDSARDYPRTDYGNAQRLVARHGGDIRFCHVWKKWLVWDDTRWAKDDSGEVIRRAKDTVRHMGAEASIIENEVDRKSLLKWALQSESEERIRKMMRLAESESVIAVRSDDFDSDPWLFNCANGTMDLRTGTLQPYRREDLITKVAPVPYDSSAACPRWQAFLARVLGNNERLITFLQRSVGYSLTGQTNEQCFFLLYGTGANGKSTFLEILRSVFLDYGQSASFSTFLASKQDRVRNDIARLRGVRFTCAIEVEENRRLSEVIIKQMTGRDTVPARFLYGEFFEFRPQFKLFLAVNHKPVITGTDHAIWRRIRLVPFTVTIPESEQDKTLFEKLQLELPGILVWAVQGCLEWQRDGLGNPEEITVATAEYRDEMDTIGNFIAERCVKHREAWVSTGELYTAYKLWAEENQEYVLPQKSFSLRLRERGFVSKRGRSRGWQGLDLRSSQEQDNQTDF